MTQVTPDLTRLNQALRVGGMGLKAEARRNSWGAAWLLSLPNGFVLDVASVDCDLGYPAETIDPPDVDFVEELRGLAVYKSWLRRAQCEHKLADSDACCARCGAHFKDIHAGHYTLLPEAGRDEACEHAWPVADDGLDGDDACLKCGITVRAVDDQNRQNRMWPRCAVPDCKRPHETDEESPCGVGMELLCHKHAFAWRRSKECKDWCESDDDHSDAVRAWAAKVRIPNPVPQLGANDYEFKGGDASVHVRTSIAGPGDEPGSAKREFFEGQWLTRTEIDQLKTCRYDPDPDPRDWLGMARRIEEVSKVEPKPKREPAEPDRNELEEEIIAFCEKHNVGWDASYKPDGRVEITLGRFYTDLSIRANLPLRGTTPDVIHAQLSRALEHLPEPAEPKRPSVTELYPDDVWERVKRRGKVEL